MGVIFMKKIQMFSNWGHRVWAVSTKRVYAKRPKKVRRKKIIILNFNSKLSRGHFYTQNCFGQIFLCLISINSPTRFKFNWNKCYLAKNCFFILIDQLEGVWAIPIHVTISKGGPTIRKQERNLTGHSKMTSRTFWYFMIPPSSYATLKCQFYLQVFTVCYCVE